MPTVHSAESSALTEDFFLGEVPPVLGATRLRQPLSETPASVTIIDRQMIEASGALDIPDVLRLVPGFQVGHVNGQQTTVTYHGLSDAYARRMQVLMDGRSIYSAFFGGVMWEDLPLAIEDIERIEVIRGPNGVSYGANSFSAVINIVTRDPADTRGTFVKLTSGAARTRGAMARYGGGDSDFRYRATVAYRESTGFPNTEDGKQVSLATYRGDKRLTDRDNLEIQLGYNGGPRDEGTQGSTTDPVRKMHIVTDFQQFHWTRTLGTDEQLGLQFYHDYYRRADTYRAILGPLQATLVEDAFLERYDLEFSHTLKPRADTRVVWGAEWRLDRVGGKGWFGTDSMLEFPLYRLFSNVEWRFHPDWILNAGAMAEYNDITGADISPRVALNYHVVPGHTLRVSGTRAYRTPAAFESSADTVIRTDIGITDRTHRGNPSLRPERITSYEAGYLGEFPSLGLQADVKIFREEIHDVIVSGTDSVTTPADPYERFVNNGETTNRGAELQLTYRMNPDTRVVFAYSYSHQRGRILKNVDPQQYITTTEYTPVHTRSLFIQQRLQPGLEASLGYYKVSHFTFAGSGDPMEYNTLDLRLAKKLRLGNARGEVSIVGQHLMGDYYDFDNKIVFDKRFFINLSIEFR